MGYMGIIFSHSLLRTSKVQDSEGTCEVRLPRLGTLAAARLPKRSKVGVPKIRGTVGGSHTKD